MRSIALAIAIMNAQTDKAPVVDELEVGTSRTFYKQLDGSWGPQYPEFLKQRNVKRWEKKLEEDAAQGIYHYP